mmetsp:Transcript_4020/g.8665  ORF Transcript_4020/g.8665 Transcript_4020/m.8665 type:complete len:592 (-) Transcript_4020:82-1857(-)
MAYSNGYYTNDSGMIGGQAPQKYVPPHLRNKGEGGGVAPEYSAPVNPVAENGWRNGDAGQMMVYQGQTNGYGNNGYGKNNGKGGGKGGYGEGSAYRPPRGGSDFVRDFMGEYENAVSGDWGNATPQLTGKEVGGNETDLTDARVWGAQPIAAPFTTFNSCTFPKQIMASIHALGFSSPTPIQAYCWPVSSEGRDLIGIAKTGSGKTLAFLLPPFTKFLNTRPDYRSPCMLVMAPTRELACQIQEQAERFGRRIGIQSVCVYGGAPRYAQQREIRQGRHLIVGTPGRLNDFLESGQLGLTLCQYLVLDEADRMLDMGFEPQIRTLIQAIPTTRQTMMFSATWPREVRRLASDYLNNPVHVQIGSHEATANKDITQQVMICNGQREKQERLREILSNCAATDRVIVFINTKRMCEQLAHDMWNDGIRCCTIHGDREQRERDQALSMFKSGRAPVMAATDVAARGLDIKGVKLVVNFDVASSAEDHIHRIGRTGRAGEHGTAITLLDQSEAKEGREVMKTMEKVGQPVPQELRDLAYSAGGGDRGRNGRWGKGYKGGKGGGKGGNRKGGGGGGGFGGGGGYGGGYGGNRGGDKW